MLSWNVFALGARDGLFIIDYKIPDDHIFENKTMIIHNIILLSFSVLIKNTTCKHKKAVDVMSILLFVFNVEGYDC